MKRILLFAGLALVAVSAILVAREPLFWKRYLLAAVYSPASLPKWFYEPTERVEGGNGPEPLRVAPELEHLDPAAPVPASAGCCKQLLALVVERATHEPYARYISEHLWKPIGAADAQLAREDEAGAPRAACCLRTRRGDWIRITELPVSDGRFEGEQVVPPGWVRAMLAPSEVNPNFGYQVWRGQPFAAELAVAGASEPYAVDDVYLLKGAGKSRLWFVPSLGVSILRTGTNSESDTDWDDSRVPDLIIRDTRDFAPRAPAKGPQDLSTLVPNH